MFPTGTVSLFSLSDDISYKLRLKYVSKAGEIIYISAPHLLTFLQLKLRRITTGGACETELGAVLLKARHGAARMQQIPSEESEGRHAVINNTHAHTYKKL